MPRFEDERYVFMGGQRARFEKLRGDAAARRAAFANRFGRFKELDEEEQEEFMRDPYKARLVEESFEGGLPGGGGFISTPVKLAGAVVGGVAGFFVGGPAGAAAGIALGSSLGDSMSDEDRPVAAASSTVPDFSYSVPSVRDIKNESEAVVAGRLAAQQRDKELAAVNEPFNFTTMRLNSGGSGFGGLDPRKLAVLQAQMNLAHMAKKEEKRGRIRIADPVWAREKTASWVWPKESRKHIKVRPILDF